MSRSLISALLGVLLAGISAAPASEGGPTLAQQRVRARLVVVGEVAAVTPYDSGRFTVAQLRLGSTLKGDASGNTIMVVERHDLPSSPVLLQTGKHVVLFLAPAVRTSALRQALPPGPYYELVNGRAGVISSASAGDAQEAAAIVGRFIAAGRTSAAESQQRAAMRALVFDELAARHPAIVADGVVGLGALSLAAATLTNAELQRLTTALRRADLPTWTRVALVETVAEQRIQALVPTLRTINDADTELRRASWNALVRLGAAPTADDLEPALTSGDPTVRAAAARALVEATHAAAIPQVTQLALTDPDRQVRNAAIEALGQTGTPEVLPSLERAFEGSEWELRQTAGRAISNIGGRPAAESFARLAFDGPPDAQKYAVTLLLFSGIPHDDPLVEHIRSTHPDEGVRRLVESGFDLHEH